jgi:folate-binding protein YgfZ
MPDAPVQTCPIDERAVIRVSGTDAASFLQAQLTQDLRELNDRQFALAAWLDAKGRVRNVFYLLRVDEEFRILCHAGLAETTVARMRLYVFRAKVEISHDAEMRVHAVVERRPQGKATLEFLPPNSAQSVSQAGATRWLRLGSGLVYGTGPAPELASMTADLAAMPSGCAEAAEMKLGLPVLAPGAEECYTAQMLNLDRLGGISFSKGCYPGQEVVARTHNLGQVKRRLYCFQAQAAVTSGADVVDANGIIVGNVLHVAECQGSFVLQAVVQIDRAAEPLLANGISLRTPA